MRRPSGQAGIISTGMSSTGKKGEAHLAECPSDHLGAHTRVGRRMTRSRRDDNVLEQAGVKVGLEEE